MPATLFAVADEPEEQPQLGGVTMADIWQSVEEAQAIHPEWFKAGQGWGPQSNDKENTK